MMERMGSRGTEGTRLDPAKRTFSRSSAAEIEETADRRVTQRAGEGAGATPCTVGLLEAAPGGPTVSAIDDRPEDLTRLTLEEAGVLIEGTKRIRVTDLDREEGDEAVRIPVRKVVEKPREKLAS